MPVQNPDELFVDYVRELVGSGLNKIIVIDDGSSEAYSPIIQDIAGIPECDLIRKDDPCGIAWAVKDGFEYYLDRHYDETYDGVVYIEGRGRYAWADVDNVAKAVSENPSSLILGEREFDKDVENNKKIGNRVTIMIFDFLYGIRTKDPQTGLRGFPNRIIPNILQIEGVDYQYMLNMMIQGKKHGIPIVSLRNEQISTNRQVFTKPYPKKNAGFIYKDLMMHFIKYIISALVSFGLDIALFQIFVGILQPHHSAYILMSTIFARAISSVWTFLFNRKVVFHSDDNLVKSLVKFYGLVAIQMFASGGLVTIIFNAIRIIPEAVIKVIVDFSIFLISYKVEKQFIFK